MPLAVPPSSGSTAVTYLRPEQHDADASSCFKRLPAEELATRLAAIVESNDDAIIGTDERHIINIWNQSASRVFGYAAGEIVGQSILLLVPPELHDKERAILERLSHAPEAHSYLNECLRKGGQRVEVSVSVLPISDTEGRYLGSAFTVRELSLQQRELAPRERLATIVNSSDDAIIAKDLNGVITEWNTAAERMFGYRAEEVIGRSILTIIPPELQHEEPMILGKIRAGHGIDHYETYRLHKSGRRVDVSLSISPLRDSRGRVIGASKIARDISERLRLDKERLLLAAIVDSSEDAIISKTLDGIITSWNASAERIFDYKHDEIIGHSVLRLIPTELQYEEPQILAKLRRGERIEHFETRRKRKNGEIFDVSLTVSPIKDSQGRIVGASKIVRDISDTKAAEAALIEKEKLVATGRLAATLAHEVNNPLESITNLAFLLANHMDLNVEARHYAELLLKEAQRAGDITRQTLSYHRAARVQSQVNVTEILEDVLRWKSRKLTQKRIKVEKMLAPVPSVQGYAGELRQVFENLMENAMDAVGEQGLIRIRTRIRGEGDRQKIMISVCDNGVGMSRFVKAKMFDPFFTTKLQTGSGLGLWVTQGILKKHGGAVRARTSQKEGRHGSVFTVTLPVRRTEAVQNQPMKNSFHVA